MITSSHVGIIIFSVFSWTMTNHYCSSNLLLKDSFVTLSRFDGDVCVISCPTLPYCWLFTDHFGLNLHQITFHENQKMFKTIPWLILFSNQSFSIMWNIYSPEAFIKDIELGNFK